MFCHIYHCPNNTRNLKHLSSFFSSHVFCAVVIHITFIDVMNFKRLYCLKLIFIDAYSHIAFYDRLHFFLHLSSFSLGRKNSRGVSCSVSLLLTKSFILSENIFHFFQNYFARLGILGWLSQMSFYFFVCSFVSYIVSSKIWLLIVIYLFLSVCFLRFFSGFWRFDYSLLDVVVLFCFFFFSAWHSLSFLY